MGDSEALLEEITAQGGAAALAQIGFVADESITNQLNEYALDYAEERSAEMVGKRWVDGELVDNPDAEWVISDTTREMLRGDIAAAIEAGTSNDDLADQLAENYAFSDARAETIARTETAYADVAGNLNAYRESGQVESKQWLISADACDECLELEDEVVGIDEDFPNDGGDGPPLHPNCFSGDAVVTAGGVSAYFKRWFKGEVIVIGAAGIADLTVTPNHPILTQRGWVAAGDLQIEDRLFQAIDPRAALTLADPDHDHIEARFDEVAGAFLMTRRVSTRAVPVSAEHFHGDGISDTEVDVVRPACALRDDRPERQERPTHCALCGRHIDQAKRKFAAPSGLDENFRADGATARGSMGGASHARALRRSDFGHSQQHGRAAVTGFEVHALPAVAQGAAVASDTPSYIHARLAGQVRAVQIKSLIRREYFGHVYNLETKIGWYLANGIIAHNCRCDVLPVLSDEESQTKE